MLKISQATEYGVRGVMHMAEKEPGRPVLVRDIAEAEKISPGFLHKIFQRMVKSRILNSRRGVGYTLALDPEKITLLAVIQANEGPINLLGRCVQEESYCERSNTCPLLAFWRELQEEVVEKLHSVSIGSLVDPRKEA